MYKSWTITDFQNIEAPSECNDSIWNEKFNA